MTSVAVRTSAEPLHQCIAVRLTEWDSLEPGPKGQAALLQGVSLGDDPCARSLASALSRSGVVTILERRDGLSIETASYIGRVVVGPLDLTITPKIAWRRWLTLMGFALRLRELTRFDRLDMQTESVALQDLIIFELLAESNDLMARGLHREYIQQRRALATPRGRIDFGRIARRGGIREPFIPCRFTRRSDDALLNQALLAGLRLAVSVARDVSLRADARRLVHELEPTIHAEPLSRAMLGTAWKAVDRRTVRYAPALRLIELLMHGQSVALEAEPDRPRVPVPGFALDMNRLWQRLLARVLIEWTDAVDIREEFSLRDVFRPNSDFPPRGSPPRPRPDFAAFRGDQFIALLDAKYRDLWNRSLPREMLYQLALYATARRGGASAMLYPSHTRNAVEERLDIRDPADGSIRGSVAMRPVHLDMLEALITAPPTMRRAVERRAFALSLVGL